MKMMKKIATLVLAVCLIIPCFSILTHAANGEIRFNDPSAKVGDTVEVVGTVKRTDGTGYGKVEITMTYDTTALKFKGGDGFTESTTGTIVYSGDATRETGPEHKFKMQFDALKAGTTKLTITEATVKSVAGATLDYTKGNSTIKIAAGEGGATVDTPTAPSDNADATGSGTGTVKVNDVTYTIANEFPENEIPQGYEASTLEYDLVKYNVVYNENSGLYLAYLVGADNVGDFFMYVEEDATFAPFEQVNISDNTTIILLSDVSEIVLPEDYAEIVLTMNGQEFPAWNNTSDVDYYVLYAMNQDGEASLYQYDSIEETYQRFTAPEIVAEDENKGFIATLTNLLENHLDYVILGTGLGFILFILIIVILGVKLYNRNAELDEIYDEYGIDADEYDTKDDVILDLNDDDDDDDYDDDDEEDDDDMTFLVREGMREVFPEDDEEESAEPAEEVSEPVDEAVMEVVKEEVVATPIQESLDELVSKASVAADVSAKENAQEDTLAQVLAKQKEAAKEDYLDEEEDFLENFSMDFIDLDD